MIVDINPQNFHAELIDASMKKPVVIYFHAPQMPECQVHEGTRVSKQDLVEGDLVFFKINRRLNHVGIYVGNGEFIHASTRAGVTRSKLDSQYWRNKFWQARRIDI